METSNASKDTLRLQLKQRHFWIIKLESLIHVILVIRCVLCLCRIIKSNIRNLYQIIDLVV